MIYEAKIFSFPHQKRHCHILALLEELRVRPRHIVHHAPHVRASVVKESECSEVGMYLAMSRQ